MEGNERGKNRRNQRTVRFVGSKVRVLRLLSQGAAERVVALENDIVQQQRQQQQQQQQQQPRRVRNCERIKGETKEKDKKKENLPTYREGVGSRRRSESVTRFGHIAQ